MIRNTVMLKWLRGDRPADELLGSSGIK